MKPSSGAGRIDAKKRWKKMKELICVLKNHIVVSVRCKEEISPPTATRIVHLTVYRVTTITMDYDVDLLVLLQPARTKGGAKKVKQEKKK